MSTFTFRELKLGEPIYRCGAMLPNQCQCTKPGKHLVLSDSNALKGTFVEYQVCEMHRRVMASLGTTVGPIQGIQGTGTVAVQNIPQKELEPRAQTEEKKNEHSEPNS